MADGGRTFPGGWADIGEPPSASAEREQVELALAHAARPDLPTDFD